MSWRILEGDVRAGLQSLQADSVQCCVTSPPYWGLRDYGMPGQIGLEATPEAYVSALVEVFREVRRVLRPDGVLWLNVGDSFWNHSPVRASSAGAFEASYTGGKISEGSAVRRRANGHPVLKMKDLVGIPWRVAFALQADGWYLRADIIWSKPNPMPEPVTDRPTRAHEYVFLMTRSARYFYDAAAIAEPVTTENWQPAKGQNHYATAATSTQDFRVLTRSGGGQLGNPDTRNCRSVWEITTQPYPEAHFATFPEALPERCILAGSKPGDLVLDPFCGAGTTGLVADRLGRDFVGLELNPAYVQMARARIGGVMPLFPNEAAG